MFLSDPEAAGQQPPASGLTGFRVPIHPVKILIAGRELACAAFKSTTTGVVIQRCVGTDGLVVGALGPPGVLEDLQRLSQRVSPAG
jgi:hypothetical protein